MGGLTYFDALLEVDNSDGALLPGMGAKVFLLTGSSRWRRNSPALQQVQIEVTAVLVHPSHAHT